MAFPQAAHDAVEAISVEAGRLAAHTLRMHAKYALDVDPRRPALAVPAAGSDGYPVRFVVVALAGEPNSEQ